MRALLLLALLPLGCYPGGGSKNLGEEAEEDSTGSGNDASNPDDNGGDNSGVPVEDSDPPTGPTDTPTGEYVRPNFSIELVKQDVMADLQLAGEARVSSVNNNVYILDRQDDGAERGKTIRYLIDSYIYPTGDWCVDGTVKDGQCYGTEWNSGRVLVDKPSRSFCLDEVQGRMFLVKDAGTRIELIDTSLEGELPYSYQSAYDRLDLPTEVTGLGKFMGPCAYLPATDELVLSSSSADQGTELVVVAASLAEDADGGATEYKRAGKLNIVPNALYALGDGRTVVASEFPTATLHRIDSEDFSFDGSWDLGVSPTHFGVDRHDWTAYVALGANGAGWIDLTDPASTLMPLDVPGDVQWAFADATHHLGWFVTDDGGTWKAFLAQDGAVVSSYELPGPVTSVAEPGDMGDLVVFYDAKVPSYVVLGPKADRNDGRPPLYIFLFTTIEEPSDTNMTLPCTGTSGFEKELDLIWSTTSMIAALDVPVAMAITDNFGEKVELCAGQIPADGERPSVDDMYAWLANDLGFTLGAMLHNRPCYNCSSGDSVDNEEGYTSNPDSCDTRSPYYIASGNSGACFPDDPEYCGLGDWECYYTFLQPRLEFADKHIPGGGSFIVGGDRHRMWEYDWIRFYSEVERMQHGLYGYDLAMFAGAWANSDVTYDDARQKNPTPWRPQDRTAAWKPGDIDNWTRDSAYSSLLYLSGTNSATIKISEQQRSGMYMADFFDFVGNGAGQIPTKYDWEDYEVTWTNLRQAVNYRKGDNLNTWYFHVHDTGITNLGNTDGTDIMLTDDVTGVQFAALEPLENFVRMVNERYVSTGEVVWLGPNDIKALYQEW